MIGIAHVCGTTNHLMGVSGMLGPSACRSITRRVSVAAVVLCLGSAIPHLASAQSFQPICTVVQHETPSFGGLSITRTGVVGESLVAPVTTSSTLNCVPSGPSSQRALWGKVNNIQDPPLSSPVTDVWATDIEGVGVRIVRTTDGTNLSNNRSNPQELTDKHVWERDPFTVTLNLEWELVRTTTSITSLPNRTPVRSSKLFAAGTMGAWGFDGLLEYGLRDTHASLAKSPTCAASPEAVNLPVVMPAHAVPEFTGIGSGTPWVEFAVNLDCRGGEPGGYVNVHITLTDLENASNRTDKLRLATGSGASGVRVQLARTDGTPIMLGSDSDTIGNPGQWRAGAVSAGSRSFAIPMKARYVQTASRIQPGNITSRATFTMAYD